MCATVCVRVARACSVCVRACVRACSMCVCELGCERASVTGVMRYVRAAVTCAMRTVQERQLAPVRRYSLNVLWSKRLVLTSSSGRNIGAVTRIMPRFPLPDKFADGDVVTFKKAFQRVAKANGWDEDGQLAALPLALSGRALIAFERGESGFKTSEDAFKYLETEFDKALDKETAMKSFNACR